MSRLDNKTIAVEFRLSDVLANVRSHMTFTEIDVVNEAITELIGQRNRLSAGFRMKREREAKLAALESHGVDNWEGYDAAMSDIRPDS